MFEEFFNKCEIQNPEKISEQQSEKIKATLQKRVAENSQPTKQPTKEENIMKTKSIRTIMIAAVAAVVGTIGIVGAASTILTREQIRDELAEKNSLTEEFQELRDSIAEYQRNNPDANPDKIGEDPNEWE